MTATQPSQRQLRTNLNDILRRVKDKRHELVAGSGEKITEYLNQAEQLNGDISKPQEEAVVSEIFVNVAVASHAVLKKIAQGGKSYTAADFTRSLKAQFVDNTDPQFVGAHDPSAFDWTALGNTIAGWFRPIPATHHMLGPMDAGAKTKRPVAQRRKKEVIAEAIRPDDVIVGGEDAQETDRNMNIVFKLVRENEGCLMTDLVLNHSSFSQTVENLFALSFLVRDRRVKVTDSPEGMRVYKAEPRVSNKKSKRDRDGEDGGRGGGAEDEDAERFQFVITFNEQTWGEWKQVVDEDATLMPNREHAQQQDEQPEHDEGAERRGVGKRRFDDDDSDDGATAGPSSKRRG